jgi:hypothetical protein
MALGRLHIIRDVRLFPNSRTEEDNARGPKYRLKRLFSKTLER